MIIAGSGVIVELDLRAKRILKNSTGTGSCLDAATGPNSRVSAGRLEAGSALAGLARTGGLTGSQRVIGARHKGG